MVTGAGTIIVEAATTRGQTAVPGGIGLLVIVIVIIAVVVIVRRNS